MLPAILRGFQAFFALIVLSLSGALVAQQQFGGSPAVINFSVFIGVFSILCMFYFFFVTFRSDSGSPMILSALDGLNLLFTFAAGCALAASLHVHSCFNDNYTLHNKITNGANNRRGRCQEAQALTAFMWFLFGTFIATTAFSLMGMRGGSRGTGPSMSQV